MANDLADLVNIFKGQPSVLPKLDYKTFFRALVSDLKVPDREIILHHVEFDQVSYFVRLDLGADVTFRNCNFRDDVIIKEIKPGETRKGKFVFENCSFSGVLKFEGCDLSAIELTGLRSSRGIVISNSKVSEVFFKGFSLTDISFDDLITESVRLIKLRSDGEVFMANLRTKYLGIHESVFKNEISIDSTNVFENILIADSDFTESVHFYGPDLDYNHSCTLNLSFSKFKSFFYYYRKGISSHNDINIQGVEIRQLCEFLVLATPGEPTRGVKDIPIRSFEIEFTSVSEGTFILRDLLIEKLNLTGTNVKTFLTLTNLSVRNLNFYNFINYGSISIINCFNRAKFSHAGVLKVKQCILNNLTIVDSNLDAFAKVRITDSSISNLKANNSRFFHYDKVGGHGHNKPLPLIRHVVRYLSLTVLNSDDAVENKFLLNKREVYKQLRACMETSGDRLLALDFKASEMRAYRSYMVRTREFWHADRIILGLSAINEYGLNWKKALLWCIISMILLYVIILIKVNPALGINFKPSYFHITIKEIVSNFRIFFQLLNPVHEVEKVYGFVKGVRIDNWTYFLDYFSRLVMSFFIFQIVSAFRKYIK